MRIECLTTFLDRTERFEEGDVRTIDDERAQRFINNGWAVEPGKQPKQQAQAAASLTPHNSTIGLGDSNG